MKYLIGIVMMASCAHLVGQSLEQRIEELEKSKVAIESQLATINSNIEDLKLQNSIQDLKAIGLPSDDYIEHSGMILSYDEAHEQAAWVSHIISTDIVDGTAHRTNDFRIDPKVPTGSAVEADYFLKYEQEDGSYDYEGFGYDRGHLAPSADFSWSEKALSESYFYSNMSPQLDDFNREIWADLEAMLRAYVVHKNTPLYLVTLPLLQEDLPKIERSVNGVSVPREYIKVALDPINNQGIAFRLQNKKADNLLPSYAITIDEAEKLSGFDFFSNYGDVALESTFDNAIWFPELEQGDKEPIYAPSLPRGHFNTVNAGLHAKSGRKITVCGHIVGSRYSRKGHLWLNLDKQYPNQIFSIFIKKEALVNFSGDVEKLVKNQDFCFTGKVELFSETPTMNISKQSQITSLDGVEL